MRKLTLMKGDEVVERREERADLPLLDCAWRCHSDIIDRLF
jgi:hypothetical protein